MKDDAVFGIWTRTHTYEKETVVKIVGVWGILYHLWIEMGLRLPDAGPEDLALKKYPGLVYEKDGTLVCCKPKWLNEPSGGFVLFDLGEQEHHMGLFSKGLVMPEEDFEIRLRIVREAAMTTRRLWQQGIAASQMKSQMKECEPKYYEL